MTELGASYPMVFAVKLASRLNIHPDEVLKMPLAKALSYDSALQVLDGTKPATTVLRKEDEEIVKFLSENQESVIEKFKNMRMM
ncbi:hypothetical protein LCGC14_1173100 [marine sediment metagenome]|uniref:Uncharacterized protein n=1 Tax=marine sediment metagenome TaxID=412755 RepID=A0A0F9MC57_9ZZZZ